MRDFLSSEYVLQMRTTDIKWTIARLYGPFAELFFFLLQEGDKRKPALLPRSPNLRFNNGIFESVGSDCCWKFGRVDASVVRKVVGQDCVTHSSCVCLDTDRLTVRLMEELRSTM